jgi:hypothetical protein
MSPDKKWERLLFDFTKQDISSSTPEKIRLPRQNILAIEKLRSRYQKTADARFPDVPLKTEIVLTDSFLK